MRIVRALWPRQFEYVLYRAEGLPAPELNDLAIHVLRPREAASGRPRVLVKNHIPRWASWYLLHLRRRRSAWLFIAERDGRYAHHCFVTRPRAFKRVFPVLREAGAVLIGPAFTASDFRGQSIYPNVLRSIVRTLCQEGAGPFYIFTEPANQPSIRGMEKAGFRRVGIWTGKRAVGSLWVRTRRVIE